MTKAPFFLLLWRCRSLFFSLIGVNERKRRLLRDSILNEEEEEEVDNFNTTPLEILKEPNFFFFTSKNSQKKIKG